WTFAVDVEGNPDDTADILLFSTFSFSRVEPRINLTSTTPFSAQFNEIILILHPALNNWSRWGPAYDP
ncbi:unnamed protein product, partial [marine sediment metagenome]